MPSLLGGNGLSIVAFEPELLTGATFGTLFIASLLSTAAGIACLKTRSENIHWPVIGGMRVRTCAAMAPLSFLILELDEDAIEGLASTEADVGVAGGSPIFFKEGLTAIQAGLGHYGQSRMPGDRSNMLVWSLGC